jgi:adenylate cyclase
MRPMWSAASSVRPERPRSYDDYQDFPGAIPIPSTVSLELGKVLGEQQQNITYRFVSDYPFKIRAPHVLDAFETDALSRLRQNPNQKLAQISSSIFSDRVRLITPVIMEQACVSCHNSHPDSPEADWKVGDVRGIQEVSIAQPIRGNIFAFKYLLGYFVLTAAVGLLFIVLQRRQAAAIGAAASLSTKISRYLSPQIYKSIFSGQKDVTIHTDRKKLAIFSRTSRTSPPPRSASNPSTSRSCSTSYFTEMSSIALAHGGTIDKFVGDSMLIFFGDPETKGDAEDAKACLRMAIGRCNSGWRA